MTRKNTVDYLNLTKEEDLLDAIDDRLPASENELDALLKEQYAKYYKNVIMRRRHSNYRR